MSIWRSIVAVAIVGTACAGTANAVVYSEGFESGYADGTNLATYTPDWYGQGDTKSPTILAGQGVGGSVGLSPAQKNFHWQAHSFQWTDPALTGVVIGMDFQTPSAADPYFPFDDDRVGWTIGPTSTSGSDYFLIDMDGGVIKARFYDAGGKERTGDITSLPSTPLEEYSWYRLRAEFTKLSDTSAQIDVTLQALDANGVPGDVLVDATVADTSTSWSRIPAPGLFTALAQYPTFKNYNEKAAANADNVYFEVIPEPSAGLLILAAAALLSRRRRG